MIIIVVIVLYLICWLLLKWCGYAFFAWYDFWIGLFYDTKKKQLYIIGIPCFVIWIN